MCSSKGLSLDYLCENATGLEKLELQELKEIFGSMEELDNYTSLVASCFKDDYNDIDEDDTYYYKKEGN